MGRQDASLDARRRPHLAAAAPRHLLDRGPQAADPRPQERQPVGTRARQARVRGRRRHGRGGRLEGQGRCRADLRPRRRHGRIAPDVAQARRWTLGARPRRDPADAAAQRAARPHRRAVRRPAQDRPRRHHRCAARCRGVRLRHRSAGRQRLHHDARLSPRHVPGRRRDAEQGAAREVLRQGRVHRQLLHLHRRRGPRAPGTAGLPLDRRGRRSRRGPRRPQGRRALEGGRSRPRADPVRARAARRCLAAPHDDAGPQPRPCARQRADRAERRCAGAWRARTRAARDPQRQPYGRHDARPRGHQALQGCRTAREHDRPDVHGLGRPVVRRFPARGHHAAARGRRQRLRRQGSVRRTHHRATAA